MVTDVALVTVEQRRPEEPSRFQQRHSNSSTSVFHLIWNLNNVEASNKPRHCSGRPKNSIHHHHLFHVGGGRISCGRGHISGRLVFKLSFRLLRFVLFQWLPVSLAFLIGSYMCPRSFQKLLPPSFEEPGIEERESDELLWGSLIHSCFFSHSKWMASVRQKCSGRADYLFSLLSCSSF